MNTQYEPGLILYKNQQKKEKRMTNDQDNGQKALVIADPNEIKAELDSLLVEAENLIRDGLANKNISKQELAGKMFMTPQQIYTTKYVKNWKVSKIMNLIERIIKL